ncbi:hypothetical protein SALBM311S_09656 [Streptomyces alboniger]
MSSFCRTLICARCADRMSETSRSRPSTDSFTRVRWSLTSRKKGRAFSLTKGTDPAELPHVREPGQRHRQRAAGPTELQDLPLEGVDPGGGVPQTTIRADTSASNSSRSVCNSVATSR